MTDAKRIKDIRALLLRHYREHRRDLPWRNTPDPYRVWISEIMLQQTRVDTVVGYFNRWMERFPDLDALAAADEHDVLLAWQGLGYYSRARNLHRCARLLVEAHGGRFPARAQELQRLPGIGPYTAGAIASIAFGERAPIVDGNVKRVLARVLDLDTPTEAPETQRQLWQAAATWADCAAPGDANQALMEFGATVCSPRRPDCAHCPANDLCLAHQHGVVQDRPVPSPRRPPRVEHLHAWVLHLPDNPERFIAVKPTGRRRFAGLWTPPVAELTSPDQLPADAFSAAWNIPLPPGDHTERPSVRHLLTHRDLRARVWSVPCTPATATALIEAMRVALARDGSPPPEVRWVCADEVPLSRFARRLLEAHLGGSRASQLTLEQLGASAGD